MKKFGQILLWILVLSGISVILGFALVEQKEVKCTELSISLIDDNPLGFISAMEIEKLIVKELGTFKDKPIDSLDIDHLERVLETNPYIERVNVYTTVHGALVVEVDREEALIRIMNKKNESFYLSRSGRPLPCTSDYTPHVAVASGFISESYPELKGNDTFNLDLPEAGHPLLKQLMLLAKVLEANQFMQEYITQIYVNSKGEIELIPADGGYVILIGNVDDIEVKFENLLTFYQAGLSKVGAENIDVLNLKYLNQVVCEK